MAKKSNLPMEVHDHFRKANVLHGYVQKHLEDAAKHALKTGNELLAAKTAVPHGSWETECGRLFDGSPRTAQFYMRFAKDFGRLKSAGQSALLMLEGTLEGAAKAAKRAAKPNAPLPATLQADYDEPIDAHSEPVTDAPETAEETPQRNSQPVTDAPETAEETPQRNSQPPKQFDRSYWLKQWEQSIGPLLRVVDKIAAGVGESGCESQKVVHDHLNVATEEMTEWMGQ